VSAESHVTCGTCIHCRTGRAHMCEQTRILGVDRDGAFAEYVAVPDSVLWQNDRAKLPPEIATLQEPFGNAVFAVGHADLAGKTVAVLGCGPVGLFSIGIARASGAGRILATDTRLFRLDLARRMGANAVVDVSTTRTAAAALVELNEGEHLDVVFEMSGAPEAIETAFEAARNGGRVILFGIPSHPVEIDVAEALIFKNLDVSAVSGRQVWDTWYRTRWLLEHGVVDLRPLVTAECGLDGYAHAFELLASGDACKVVLHPRATVAEAAA
jgi:threonine 3-dehydrogenase